MLVLAGVEPADTEADVAALANKISGLRVFADDAGKMNRSVVEVGGGILLVSQFTLYGDTRRGRRPSFTGAAAPEHAEPLIEALATALRTAEVPVELGVFGAMMEVELVNDGPVTLILETRDGKVI